MGEKNIDKKKRRTKNKTRLSGKGIKKNTK
jgi:hypothetical protein